MSPKIYDCFLFANELDVLEIRLNETKDVVDKVVLGESTQTHSGGDKPLWFNENRDRFSEFKDKIIYIEAPRTKHEAPFDVEVFQRSCLLQALAGCQPDDIILVGDVDEIPRASVIKDCRSEGIPLRQTMYIYYLNGFWTTVWNGTVLLSYRSLMEGFGGDLWRVRLWRRRGDKLQNAGWHFSWLGGPKEVMRKIAASSECDMRAAAPVYMNEERLKQRIEEGLEPGNRNRPVTYVPLDDTFPKYLLENQDKFQHLIRKL